MRLSLGGAALTPPGAVMSSTSLLSCSVWVCSNCSASLGGVRESVRGVGKGVRESVRGLVRG